MKELQEIAIKLISNHPMLVPFALFIVYYIKNSNFRKLFNKTVRKFITLHFHSSIFTHDLFFQRELFIVQINRVKFNCDNDDNKTKLFQILLKEKINAVIDVSQYELKRHHKAMSKAHPAIVSAKLFKIIDKIIETYEKNIKKQYITEYGEKTGRKLFDFIYTENFKVYHAKNIAYIERKIMRLPYAQSKNFNDVIKTFLTKIQDATDDAILDCEEVFEKTNGKINSIIGKKLS